VLPVSKQLLAYAYHRDPTRLTRASVVAYRGLRVTEDRKSIDYDVKFRIWWNMTDTNEVHLLVQPPKLPRRIRIVLSPLNKKNPRPRRGGCSKQNRSSQYVVLITCPILEQSRQRRFHCLPVVFLATAGAIAPLSPVGIPTECAATIRLTPPLHQALFWPLVRRCR